LTYRRVECQHTVQKIGCDRRTEAVTNHKYLIRIRAARSGINLPRDDVEPLFKDRVA